jgi:hypothetical protein
MRWVFAGLGSLGCSFRKDCRWSPRGLIAGALLWAWSREEALTERFEQALNVVGSIDDCQAPRTTSYQAFLKLLTRWTSALTSRLISHLRTRMKQTFPAAWRIAGFVVFAADGSKCELPRTRSNEGRYSPKKSRKKPRKARGECRQKSRAAREQRAKEKKADSPQMSLTALFHLGLKLPWDWRTGASDESEREHLRQMLPDLPADALITADCGFVGYEFWRELLDRKLQFVIRVGGNVRLLTRLGWVREADGTVYLWPEKAARRGQPPLVLRLVVVQGGRHPWYLVTSVLDRRRLRDSDVATIYRKRWGIELFFRDFKQTYRRGKLRSHTADNAACELQWSLLGLWTMMFYAKAQLFECGMEPDCLSVAQMLKAFGHAVRGTLRKLSLADALQNAVQDPYQRRDKRSRGYPRKKYEPPTKPPEIQPASQSQRDLARQFSWTAPGCLLNR